MTKCMSIFAKFGKFVIVVTDNLLFNSIEFKSFEKA